VKARFLFDATGPRGCLHRHLKLPEAPLEKYPQTQGIYAHFEGVKRWETLHPSPGSPYPPDNAALHHVFPGGWMWVLRFDGGLCSAGRRLDGFVGE